MDNIASGLSFAGLDLEVRRSNRIRGFRFEHLGLIKRSDIVLLHTPLLMSWHYAFLARLFGKTIVSIVWDSYPVTLGGVRFDRRMRRRLFDRIENTALSASNRLLVPSQDFLEQPILHRAKAVRLWYAIHAPNMDSGPASYRHGDDEPLKVLFAGQINRTRGLAAATEQLHRVTQGRFQLLIASGDPLPPELSGRPDVRHLGKLDRENLRRVAAGCDCGLVALACDFDGPGLPSKTFEYLEAGIPCLYYGKRLEHYLDVLEWSGAGIEIGARANLTRDDVLAKKADIANATIRFSDAFALDRVELIAHLGPVQE
ncbi:glycosyltransferase family 4 protein [Sphingopyxis lindanitolerans]|nr:glycosyltransferase family 4 protein [Sphingopyxis lindanitolerans]